MYSVRRCLRVLFQFLEIYVSLCICFFEQGIQVLFVHLQTVAQHSCTVFTS